MLAAFCRKIEAIIIRPTERPTGNAFLGHKSICPAVNSLLDNKKVCVPPSVGRPVGSTPHRYSYSILFPPTANKSEGELLAIACSACSFLVVDGFTCGQSLTTTKYKREAQKKDRQTDRLDDVWPGLDCISYRLPRVLLLLGQT